MDDQAKATTIERLRELWKNQNRAMHALQMTTLRAKAEQMRAEREYEDAMVAYDTELHALQAALFVGPGEAVDVLGDGKIKPADKIAKTLRKEEKEKDNAKAAT